MRDLLVFGLMLAWVPMAFMSVFVAFLLWVFVSLVSPQLYLYGFMADFRYAFLFAGIALGLLFLGRLKNRGTFILDKITIILMIFVAHAIVSAILAINSNPWIPFRLETFLKGMALALVAPLFITSRWRLHLTIVVLIAGLGFHGLLDGLKVIASGGAHNVRGIPGGPLGDNNLMAVGMVMILPLCLYMIKRSARNLAKWIFIGVFILLVLTIVGSNSRGGFLALAVVGIWYWITSQSKMMSAIFLAVVTAGVIHVAPERWFERVSTIKTAAEDQSFLGRVAAWKVSINIANTNPIFGGGFDATQAKPIWDMHKHTPNIIDYQIPEGIDYKAAHSIYFQVLGDMGYVGLLIFLALLAAAFVTRWEIKGLVKSDPARNSWASDLATALTLSLVAFMAGGGGVSVAYFEVAHFQIVLLAVLKRLVEEQSTQKKVATLGPSYVPSSRHV